MKQELLSKSDLQDAGVSLREIHDHAVTQAQQENLPIIFRASAGTFLLPVAAEMLIRDEGSGARAAGVVLGGLGVGLIFDALVRREETETVKRVLSGPPHRPPLRVPQTV